MLTGESEKPIRAMRPGQKLKLLHQKRKLQEMRKELNNHYGGFAVDTANVTPPYSINTTQSKFYGSGQGSMYDAVGGRTGQQIAADVKDYGGSINTPPVDFIGRGRRGGPIRQD